ncbi:unnamed protein product [Owenia fusiformis]|uniref:Uncharacterized protein n=1 Tax=Owenia fusiformis TaxID=6347 RepID=A0A8J1XMZ0_OWEFU|nr:unnamed protein product [Owenia fusiformis]
MILKFIKITAYKFGETPEGFVFPIFRGKSLKMLSASSLARGIGRMLVASKGYKKKATHNKSHNDCDLTTTTLVKITITNKTLTKTTTTTTLSAATGRTTPTADCVNFQPITNEESRSGNLSSFTKYKKISRVPLYIFAK